MTNSPTFAETYRPTHDERARQQFVGALKGYLNGPLEVALADDYERRIRPAFRQAEKRDPEGRRDVERLFSASPLFQLWGAAVYESQDMMWQVVEETVQRLLPDLERRYAAIDDRTRCGGLTLDPSLELPEPIRSVEIHRQPGGYFAEPDRFGLVTGLRYFATIELYRAAKGMATGERAGEPGMGDYVVANVLKRFPDIRPNTVLDLGCGPGIDIVAYRRAWPDATIRGLDLSAPLLRFAHAWAEDQGLAIHYHQANAAQTGFDDESVDLIVSSILFHETSDDILRAALAEARRILAPGGVLLNFDVAYQPGRISVPKQVTNNWQVANNGEPYWTGFAELDMRTELEAAGFDADNVIAEYEPMGNNELLVFGARKTA